jgi:acetoin utilization deacetylase AcuC-like enzyme
VVQSVSWQVITQPFHFAAHQGTTRHMTNLVVTVSSIMPQVAAQHMRDEGLERVAVLDVDFHHGNGTQAIFYHRSDVLFLSLHGDPMAAFPHFLGHKDEIGIGDGEGFNFNFPMPAGTDFSKWSNALDSALHQISKFGADAVIVSLGVDTFERDPISFFKLKSDDFRQNG